MASSRTPPRDHPLGSSVDALALYTDLLRIRRFEERTAELFQEGRIVGTAHSAVGQEAVAVGAAAGLHPDDYIVGHHRSHGHLIARGARTERMMAELLGRRTGYCQGVGGSMHITDLTLGILGCNGVVGAGLPIGCGAALSAQLRGTDQVTVVFFGDGAAGQGLAHEALNLAAIWRLPVVFVCENNEFQLSAVWQEIRPVEDVAARADSYGMPSQVVDGNDVLAVRGAILTATAHARSGAGPYFVEAKTYRRMEHSMRANLPELRAEEEMRRWEQRDPLGRFVTEAAIPPDDLETAREAVETELETALRDAEAAEVIDPAELDRLVYAPAAPPPAAPAAGERRLRFNAALNEALHLEMAADDSVIVLGEDVGELGGIFRVTDGLWQRFGGDRVRNTPISEGGFVGAAVGAAMTGLRPVVEIQIFDFITLAMDSIVNQAAKLHFMTGGQASVPMVVRGPSGGGVRLAAQHSQSLESWFAHIPGLNVVAPSSAYDAKGLLAAAIQDDNPVVVLEAKSLLFAEDPVPEDRYALALGQAATVRTGSDVTIVAVSGSVPVALRAAARLEREGVSAEVIDPRTVYPLDLETIIASVSKTNRAVVVHEAVAFCGFGAEIAASLMEHAFDELDAPVLRVTAPHRPMPYQKDLERATIPDVDQVLTAVRSLG